MKEPKVIICVSNGSVHNVYANMPDLDVVVLDYDTYEGFSRKQMKAEDIIAFVDEQRVQGNTATEFVEVYP